MTLAVKHIDALKALLGPKGHKTNPDDVAPHLHEWRDRWQGHTPLLAMPGDTAQVGDLVRYCAEHKIAITPQGGNTGLVGAQIPQGEILLLTSRLNKVRSLDASNATMTVEAGVTLASARAAAADAGLLFPLSLASEGSATMGGVLSTNAGGMEVLRYGNARDLALGLEVVTPRGEMLDDLKGLRKDNSGYDLKQVFIGAEGTLGVITAAVVKLYPPPPFRLTAWCALQTVDDAIALLAHLRHRYGDAISKFELVPQIGVDYALKNVPGNRAPLSPSAPWHVLLELGLFAPPGGDHTLEQVLASALQNGRITDAAIAQSDTQAMQFVRMRESLSAAQKGEGLALKHDISVPVSAIAKFIETASAEVQSLMPASRIFAFGHVGDGNVHFDVLQPLQTKAHAFETCAPHITKAVYTTVLALGGSISAEHGIGVLKRTELRHQKSKVQMQAMRAIKTAFDPDNIMNPRVLF